MTNALSPHPRRSVWIGYCVDAGWSSDEIAEVFDLGAGTAEAEDDDAGADDEDDVTVLELH